MKGFKKEFSVPRTPQQNGIVERKNRTLIEAARTMLADSLLPIPLWAEAVNTACYVHNRVLVTKPHNKTPYELLHGRTPSIGFMRPFSCPVTILNTLDSLGKFKGNVDEGFLVGYSVNSKAFRVFNSRTRIVQETLHVNFLENKPNIAGSGPTWLFDIDSLTRTMNYQPVTAGNQTNPNADAAFDGKEHDFDEKKPESEVILSASSRYRDLSAEFEDCSDNNNNEVNAAGTIVPTVGQNSSNSTNPFSAAGPSNTTASPTHGKSSFIDASQLFEDPDMPELEDITYSDDENDVVNFPHRKRAIGTKWVYRNKKDKRGTVVRNKARLVTQGHTQEDGIDFEEVFALVARIEAIRLFLAYASFMGFMVYQMDVNSAFLYGTIKEEVYVCQPPGFEDPDNPNKHTPDPVFRCDPIWGCYIWAAILKTFGGNEATKKTKKNLLKQQYGNFKAEGSETLEQTFNRLQVIAVQLQFMDVEIEQDDLNKKFLIKETEAKNSQNMAFISSAKHSSRNKDGNTASVPTASTNVPTATTSVATISQDTACAYIASQSSDKFWKKTDKKISIQGSDVAGFDKSKDWSYMANDEEDHALVANEGAPTEFALMANTSAESKVFDNSLCSKDCKKNNDSLNSKITDLTDKLSDANNFIYHYKLALAQVESRLVEYNEREVKYIEKIKTPEYYNESYKECNDSLKKKLETLQQEKEGVDGKLAGLLTASKDLDNLIESQRSEKNKEGLGYNAVPLPTAQLYLSPKKDLSWTGLPECADDTVIDYSRPSPTVESILEDDQYINPSDTVASPITSKPFIKFVKPKDNQSDSKTDKKETPKKPPVKYAEQYIKPNIKPKAKGNQRNWNNLKSQQLGLDFVMKKNACFNCVRSPSRAPWVPTVNRNYSLVNRKFFTGSRNFLTANRKFPTASRKFLSGSTKSITADMELKGKAGSSQNKIDDKGYWDGGCSRHMTGNISYLSDFEPYDRGYVSFVQGGCKITGKGTIKTGKLEFENVYFVKDLKYNLFSVSQIYDNMNNVLFTNSECIVLGRDFKLLDDANILLKTPRQHNMYSIDLNNIVPHRDLTCLVAKVSTDECMLWHRRPGHLTFKTMNKLVRHNLVRGIPTKCFENDHTCTACLKGKQHKASSRTMLADAKLPVTFWAEAVNTACYVQNMVLVNKSHNKTPYELFNGRSPAIGFIKPFGCHVMILNTLDNLGKFEEKGDEGAKDATSQEVKKDASSLRYIALPNWAHDALLEFSSMESLIPSVSSPVPTAYSTDSQEPSSDARLISKRVVNQEETPSLDNILSLTNRFEDILGVEPKKIFDALQDPSWVEVMQEELLQFKIQNAWTLVDCPKGVRPIGTKWVLKNKKDERGIFIRNKARLVAQGHTQEEGIDYDEVFAPVARIEAIRLFLAYASFMGFTVYQMDMKSTFLYGTIDEEVYVMQPPGFQDPKFSAKVYKVEKAVYGLHQAPRVWYGTLLKYLLKNGFQRGKIDQTLFIKKQREDFILVQVYVVDIIFGSSNPQLCREFEAHMHDKFQMSAIGELNFFLGLQVLQKEDGIFLLQDKYVGDILKKFRYSDVRSLNTPMDKENPWGNDRTGKDVDLHLYRSMIGSLMYLTASRPDIMFAICACARNQVTPKEGHLHAVKRIFRYLKGHPKLGLWYPKESPFDLVSFSYSDYGGATQDRKSTTGGCQFLGRRLISWQCKKYTIMATSTTEAEYVATASCCGQVLWIQNQLLDYGLSMPCEDLSREFSTSILRLLIPLGEHNTDFHPMVDFLEASPLRRNLKLRDEEGISSLPDAELFENLTLMGYNISPNQNSNIATALVCLATNRTYNFSKMIFDGLVKNVNNKVSKFLMYQRFLTMCLRMSQFGQITRTQTYVVPLHTKNLFTTLRVNSPSFSGRTIPLFDTMLIQPGEGSGTPTEPHYIPSQEAQPSSHTHISSSSLPPVTTTSFPTITSTETTPIRQYTRRTRIAQSSVPLTVVDEPTSPQRDVNQGKACPTDSGFIEDQDRVTINKSSTVPHDSAPRVTSPAAVEGKRVKQLEEREGVAATNSGDDALIKGMSMDKGEAATERVSDDTEEMATVLTSMDVATVLASRVVDVPTGSGSIPTASTPAEGSVPIGSEEVPTASPVFATTTVVTPVTRRKGKEVMLESETPKKPKVQEQIDAQVARELEEQLEKKIKEGLSR
nr:retrovirus-related Pol polyprotein from transposon TNT 1-94 [Tanacetum cinerariifolium]